MRVRDIGALVLVINPESAESINLPQIRELLQSPNRSGSFRVIDKRRKVVRSDSGETGESNVIEDTVVPGKFKFSVTYFFCLTIFTYQIYQT